MNELLREVFTWWLVIFIIGTVTLPFASTIFNRFFDKGYIFSKIIGITVITYAAYVLGTIHMLPFTTASLGIIFAVFLVSSFIFIVKNINSIFKKNDVGIFLFEEVLFLGGLFLWSFVKSFQPDIHGLEKFMDYGFINSILRTTYFPTKDMWMTPLSINYYYFGHIMTAVLTRFSFLPSAVTFNLMLATLFSLTFTQTFSLGSNFIHFLQVERKQKKRILSIVFGGLTAAILLTFGGNLHTLYTLFTPYQNENPVPPTQLVFSPLTFPNQYWYPNATRFIYHTIHEFPIYSFVVSDLHGHVLDIPAVLLMIAALFLFVTGKFTKTKSFFISIVFLSSLASIMYMTNAWDGLIYGGIISITIFLKLLYNTKETTNLQIIFSKKFLLSLILAAATFVVISLPFSVFFKPFASHIGLNCAPQFLLNMGSMGPLIFEQGYCQTSPLWQLAILYGFFFFWFVSLLTFSLKQYKKTKHIFLVDYFILGIGLLGFTLIIIPEFFYLKDIYTTYFRANTMFKLVYQAFILLTLVSAYTIYRIFSALQSIKKNIFRRMVVSVYICISIVLLSFVLIYPYFAVMSYFNGLKDFQGLNGLTYLQQISNDDYTAVLWINKHIAGQPVMLEAQGDSYTDYERISSNTGLPTVFGWMVHEWLWRGTYDVVPQRIADVKTLYESHDLTQTKNLLQQYHVSYVYVGDMERAKYPKLDGEKFAKLGTVIYNSGNVKIYKTND